VYRSFKRSRRAIWSSAFIAFIPGYSLIAKYEFKL
jgi:hypothetical protein